MPKIDGRRGRTASSRKPIAGCMFRNEKNRAGRSALAQKALGMILAPRAGRSENEGPAPAAHDRSAPMAVDPLHRQHVMVVRPSRPSGTRKVPDRPGGFRPFRTWGGGSKPQHPISSPPSATCVDDLDQPQPARFGPNGTFPRLWGGDKEEIRRGRLRRKPHATWGGSTLDGGPALRSGAVALDLRRDATCAIGSRGHRCPKARNACVRERPATPRSPPRLLCWRGKAASGPAGFSRVAAPILTRAQVGAGLLFFAKKNGRSLRSAGPSRFVRLRRDSRGTGLWRRALDSKARELHQELAGRPAPVRVIDDAKNALAARTKPRGPAAPMGGVDENHNTPARRCQRHDAGPRGSAI